MRFFGRITFIGILFFYLFSGFFFSEKNLILLNSGRDYIYLFSPQKETVIKKLEICDKEASCTDIISFMNNFFVILHRISYNTDGRDIYVLDKVSGNLLRKIPIAKSPYHFLKIDKFRYLISHTLLEYDVEGFISEIFNIKKESIEKKFVFRGIPVGVISFLNGKFAVIEDVRGTIGGVELVELFGKRKFLLKNRFISSNIFSCNGKLFCAVNHFGPPKSRNSLLQILFDKGGGHTKVKILKKFEISDPIILGTAKNYLFIGFNNHSFTNNYNRFGIYDVKTGSFTQFSICYGPESIVYCDGKLYIACIQRESIAIINLKNYDVKVIDVSDCEVGFSRIRMGY